MSVSSTTNKVIYTGSGGTGPFDFTFKIFLNTDLVVLKYTIADGTTETLVLTTDYTVIIDGDNGGSVTLTSSLSSSYKLVITRQLPLTQAINYVANDPFPAETHEEGLDRATMRDQQLQEQLDRVVLQSPTQTTPIVLPTPADGFAIGWSGTSGAMQNLNFTGPTGPTGPAGATTVRGTFTNASLSAGILTITHNGSLSSPYVVDCSVYNNSGVEIIPDQINTFTANDFKVDLTSYGTLTGTWSYSYVL